jgi:hypothetical protein
MRRFGMQANRGLCYRLKVIHNDRFGRDDAAAWACIRIDRLAPGYRLLHLWDSKGLPSIGVLLVNIQPGWSIRKENSQTAKPAVAAVVSPAPASTASAHKPSLPMR